jgi:hypothetical protein
VEYLDRYRDVAAELKPKIRRQPGEISGLLIRLVQRRPWRRSATILPQDAIIDVIAHIWEREHRGAACDPVVRTSNNVPVNSVRSALGEKTTSRFADNARRGPRRRGAMANTSSLYAAEEELAQSRADPLNPLSGVL